MNWIEEPWLHRHDSKSRKWELLRILTWDGYRWILWAPRDVVLQTTGSGSKSRLNLGDITKEEAIAESDKIIEQSCPA